MVSTDDSCFMHSQQKSVLSASNHQDKPVCKYKNMRIACGVCVCVCVCVHICACPCLCVCACCACICCFRCSLAHVAGDMIARPVLCFLNRGKAFWARLDRRGHVYKLARLCAMCCSSAARAKIPVAVVASNVRICVHVFGKKYATSTIGVRAESHHWVLFQHSSQRGLVQCSKCTW